MAKWISQPADRQLPEGDRDEPPGLGVYLALVASRLNFLEFGDPSELLGSTHGIRAPPSPLAEIWEPPRVQQLTPGLAVAGRRVEGARELELQDALSAAQRLCVLLADPGGGKSTVGRHVACTIAAEGGAHADSPIPIFVPARFLQLTGQSYESAVVGAAVSQLGPEADMTPVREVLMACLPRAYVIVDGLDEVAVDTYGRTEVTVTRRLVLGLARYLAASYPNVRCLVTCRSSDYASEPNLLLDEATHLAICGLSDRQVSSAVHKWHERARLAAPQLGADYWPRRATAVLELIRSDADIGQLATVPLLLTLLQVVYSGERGTPRSISQLVDRAVGFLEYDKPRVGVATRVLRTGGEGANDILEHEDAQRWLMEILRTLAYRCHQRFVDGTKRGVPITELQAVASEIVQVRGGNYSTAGLNAFKVVEHLLRGHGVLVESEAEIWDFPHAVFREVLAGQYLNRLRIAQRVDLARTPGWRLPLRYWAGTLAQQPEGFGQIYHMASELHEQAKKHRRGRSTLVLALAEIVTEAASVALGPNDTLPKLVDTVRRDLLKLIEDSALAIDERVRAGDLLGAIGDPRLGRRFVDVRLVLIPGGQYRVGRAEPHKVAHPKYQQCPASPELSGRLPAFRIGMFLVTNRDFAEFISAGGYSEERYWQTEQGRAWLKGDAAFLRELEDTVNNTALLHFFTEMAAGRVKKDELDNLRDRILRRRLPLYWYNPRFNRPNQPVVGVNWWEAMAFCAWATEQLAGAGLLRKREIVTLPDEIEWECAARGPALAAPYPWGSDPPDQNAHVRAAARDPRTCAVGLFPWARYPGGPLDVVGNVWEWTRSVKSVRRQDRFQPRTPLDSCEERVVRGSSWLSGEEESPCVTFRSFDPPCNAYEDLGLRIAIVAPEP